MQPTMNPKPPAPLNGPPFAAAIGLGAFLLFLVQFIMGKLILPWFGGAAAVWTTCMLFFQVGLLLGYGYAHLLTSYLSPRWQRDVHILLLLLSFALLAGRAFSWPSPLLPDDSWKPRPAGSPSLQILLLLSLTVGLPYLVLSATGPLLQAWFARLRPGQLPYRLYALSNLGSLLGLLSYPFVLEPSLTLPAQGRLWALGFGLFAIGCSFCALPMGRLAAPPLPATRQEGRSADPGDAPPLSRYGLWFALAAVASVMLLAATNQICQEVAVVPFLWMLPLCLYLLSFILCFEFERLYRRAIWGSALILSAAASAGTLHWGTDAPLPVQLGAYSLVLLAYCMVCHGELAALKPPARYLTSFYLTLSAGGAAGGLFSALLAPAVFPAFWEFHCALLAGVILLGVLLWRERGGSLYWGGRSRLASAAVGVAVLVGLGAVLVQEAMDDLGGAVYVSRNFFGVLRVSRRGQGTDEFLRLKHGRTPHGMQYTEPQRHLVPTTFYNPGSGVGLALANHPRRQQGGMRVGVVGLGAGTLAAYARPGDSYRFYEINPEVIRLSTSDDPLFTYLRDARGQVTTVLGDARLSLEHEPPQEFDLLALDAFSSDAIPIHLLTREAVDLYLRHMKQDGILAVHITNRYLDLRPVIRGIMEQTGLFAVLIDQESDQDDFTSWYSRWVLLSRQRQSLAAKEVLQPGVQLTFDGGRRVLWTDAHSDLWRVRRQ